jgi:hypothetical protein
MLVYRDLPSGQDLDRHMLATVLPSVDCSECTLADDVLQVQSRDGHTRQQGGDVRDLRDQGQSASTP